MLAPVTLRQGLSQSQHIDNSAVQQFSSSTIFPSSKPVNMSNPFLTSAAFVSPSLNRIRLIDLPGCRFPAAYRGLSGYDLLSAASLHALVTAQADELELQADAPDLLRAFNGCFNDSSPRIQAAASKIAETYGRRLAILLLTLKRADESNRLARPAWQEQHWAFWQDIAHFYIGGGLLSGAMGPLVVACAVEELVACGFAEVTVKHSPFGQALPLAGLARTAPAEVKAMLLLDFGHTNVKRAVAFYQDSRIVELRELPLAPAAIPPANQAAPIVEIAQNAADKIVELAANSWLEIRRRNWPVAPAIAVSLACYLIDGHPPASEMGYYGRLQLLADHLQAYLSDRISAVVGQTIKLLLVHDGSAAALVYAGQPQTAVLLLGTAIGVGFAPATDSGLRSF